MQYRISVAPMMDWTDKHERYFLRLLSKHVWLYTEMITSGAIIHGDRSYLLDFHPTEHPIALQLGGSEPEVLAVCAQIGEEWGYDEINLNVGCPSPRVSFGNFGACLMLDSSLVARCIEMMQLKVNIPISVKCRIGVDDDDSYEHLSRFIHIVSNAGCQHFIIHARKAWLTGLSPKQNREIPPLKYDRVRQIKKDFPQLFIVVNGGIKTVEDVQTHLQNHQVDGVMIGRSAYTNPYLLAELEQEYFKETIIVTRQEVMESFILYMQTQLDQGVKLSAMTRHILGLFQGQPGARAWRRYLSENAPKTGAGIEVVEAALKYVSKY